ncbi:4-hydroxybenzoate polyprenyltransferase [Halorubrum aquaticum]|uniref:4-hydroxybenzoate polyprenyltransferase n=1 Tax=Halorubrum aquaticum TaxID=387340 RepID=A0A1I3BBD9_9EURY|nr:prenyltransferase [Halorubrum aquaticum]SFH59594.1 4-hydroxybenzoate polyprenyltransferase [Halorubrum aquaticum]
MTGSDAAGDRDGDDADRAGDGAAADLADHLRYLLVLSRPRFWLYLAGPVAVGVAYGIDGVDGLFTPTTLALAGYFLVPANVFLYGVNDVFDADVDAHNPKKGDREARWRGNRLALLAVVVAAALGVGTFAVTPPVAWPFLAGFFVLAAGYSVPPVRFKTTPFADSVSNGLYVLPGAAAYATVAGTAPPTFALAGAWLWTMGMHTFSAIPDVEPDREAGIRTTATLLGESRTYAYCLACWVAAAVAFAAVDVRLGALLGVYPVFVTWVAVSGVAVDRAYWWFPALNTVVGALFTMGGLWRIYPVWEALG